jgi:Raf kinase inhibitor-like YbhB/YbcL family protein
MMMVCGGTDRLTRGRAMLLTDLATSARIFSVRITIALALVSSVGCGNADPLPSPEHLTIQVRSTAFAEGGMIPDRFTCDGSNRSPALSWYGVPEQSRTLALICDDPDAPAGTWSHWVVFNLPARLTGLKEGVPPDDRVPNASIEESPPAGSDSGARQGTNDFRKIGYGGPCPPSGTHRYFFRLYALDDALELGPEATRADVLKAIKGHILAEGRLIGKYSRGGKK